MALTYQATCDQKKAAQTEARKAVRRGDLLKAPCERCGSPHSVAHHDDYSHPLSVTWLCNYHHCMRHQELGWGVTRMRGKVTEPRFTNDFGRYVWCFAEVEIHDEKVTISLSKKHAHWLMNGLVIALGLIRGNKLRVSDDQETALTALSKLRTALYFKFE